MNFVNRHGFLHQTPERLISHYAAVYPERKIATPNDLRQLAIDGEIVPNDLFRFRGCGNKRQPGKIVLFCFPHLKSAAEQKMERINSAMGDGI